MALSPSSVIAIVGAGQSGLAAASAAKAAGFRPLILEAGERPVGSWPSYYDSLTLFSPARFSAFPGAPFPGDPTSTPPATRSSLTSRTTRPRWTSRSVPAYESQRSPLPMQASLFTRKVVRRFRPQESLQPAARSGTPSSRRYPVKTASPATYCMWRAIATPSCTPASGLS